MSSLTSITPSIIPVAVRGGSPLERSSSVGSAPDADPSTVRPATSDTNARNAVSPENDSADVQRRDRTPAAGTSEALQQQQDQQVLRALSARDLEVRQHEMAHQAAGGGHTGAVSYSYQRGPDGRMYAVGGEVSIDTSAAAGDPRGTLEKAEAIIRAAMAPAEPSSQDYRVAASARAMAAEARSELAKLEESGESDGQNTDEADVSGDQAVADETGTGVEAASGAAGASGAEAVAAASSGTSSQTERGGLNTVQQQLVSSGAYGRMYPPGSLLSLQA